MKKLVVVVLVLLLGIAALGYARGWFSVDKEGNADVQVNRAKYKQDKEAVGKKLGEETKALKERIANLWTKTEGLTGDEKDHAKKELAELEKKHKRLEQQLKELEDADPEKFDSIKHDISKSLEEVEQKISEVSQELARRNDK